MAAFSSKSGFRHLNFVKHVLLFEPLRRCFIVFFIFQVYLF